MKRMAHIRFEQRTRKWQLWSGGRHIVQSSDRDAVITYAETHDFVLGEPDRDATLRELLEKLK